MNAIEGRECHPDGIVVAKKPYVPPKLLRYGAVRDLTQAGSGTIRENQQPSQCAQTPSRYPCGYPSERFLKANVVRVGDHPLGVGLYLFDYKPEYRLEFGQSRQIGVMADEVEAVLPEAIMRHPRGFRMVNYQMLGILRATP